MRIILPFLFYLKNIPSVKKLLIEISSELHVTAKSYFQKYVSRQLRMSAERSDEGKSSKLMELNDSIIKRN